MAKRHLKNFPKPLLDDLVGGRWLPIVGAGMSRNAIVDPGDRMPLWDDLGKELARDLPEDYSFTGTLDAISAYCHEYSRSRLVEAVSEALLIDRARPGVAHRAFCAVPFDLVCTTNFDFLLERQYEVTPRYCRPIIDEEQLSVNTRSAGVTLLKLHGDVHHPQRLVVTEEDYDGFLDRFPLLATYLASLLISRTAVLIGYSLDDPDFRQVWQVVNDRLGRARRLAYAIVVDATPTEIARFERRGVKVVNLIGSKSNYAEILAEALDELREYWTANVIPASQVTEEDPLRELSLPQDAQSRLCFFAVPFSLHSFYRERVFPIAERAGFVPVTADDVVTPGETIMAKIEAMIERSVVVLIDASSPNTLAELRIAVAKKDPSRVVIIQEVQATLPINMHGTAYMVRPRIPFADAEGFLERLQSWFDEAATQLAPELAAEPLRLLNQRENRAAVISAMSLLESAIRARMKVDANEWPQRMSMSLGGMLPFAINTGLIRESEMIQLKEWMLIRNLAVHENRAVPRKKATEVVAGVTSILRRFDGDPPL